MAAIYVFLRRRRQNIRRNRVSRDHDNPLDYTDDIDIISKYRLSRPLILNLCQMFQNDLQRPTMRSHTFPVSLQIMVALRFYATGSFQQVNADEHNISKGSVSNITKDVTQCLNFICRQYIKMPIDRAELRNVMHGFHDIANFPNVAGTIDGTHIRISAPSADENFYVNRKKYHSINVMGVCDASM